jgi:hypothetical protein
MAHHRLDAEWTDVQLSVSADGYDNLRLALIEIGNRLCKSPAPWAGFGGSNRHWTYWVEIREEDADG